MIILVNLLRCKPLTEKTKSENGHLITKTAILSLIVVGGLTWWINSKQNEILLQNIREIIREEIAAERANSEIEGNDNDENGENQDQNDNRTTANL